MKQKDVKGFLFSNILMNLKRLKFSGDPLNGNFWGALGVPRPQFEDPCFMEPFNQKWFFGGIMKHLYFLQTVWRWRENDGFSCRLCSGKGKAVRLVLAVGLDKWQSCNTNLVDVVFLVH